MIYRFFILPAKNLPSNRSPASLRCLQMVGSDGNVNGLLRTDTGLWRTSSSAHCSAVGSRRRALNRKCSVISLRPGMAVAILLVVLIMQRMFSFNLAIRPRWTAAVVVAQGAPSSKCATKVVAVNVQSVGGGARSTSKSWAKIVLRAGWLCGGGLTRFDIGSRSIIIDV